MGGGPKAKIAIAPPPPPPPTPADPQVQKNLDTAVDVEKKVRGRASTYLTDTATGLGDGSFFKRTLLGS